MKPDLYFMQNAQKNVLLLSPHLHWLTPQLPLPHCARWRKVPTSQAFSLSLPVVQCIFILLEVPKWQPKQGIMLESAFQTTSNACIYCRAANCSAGPHKDRFRKSRLQGACTLHNAIPSHAGSRFFSKLNAKPVTAKYSISLGGLGYINLEWGCKVQLMVKNITSLTLPDRLFIKIKNFFESSREDLIKDVGKYHIQEQIC